MRKKLQSGQSFFEVVIAMAMMTIVLVTLVALASVSIRNSTFSRNKTLATRLSQEAIEWLRGQKDAGWSTFSVNATTPSWCFTTLAWSKPGNCGPSDVVAGTIFTRLGTFSIIDPNTIQTNVNVSWTDSQGFHQVQTSTYFTNWKAR